MSSVALVDPAEPVAAARKPQDRRYGVVELDHGALADAAVAADGALAFELFRDVAFQAVVQGSDLRGGDDFSVHGELAGDPLSWFIVTRYKDATLGVFRFSDGRAYDLRYQEDGSQIAVAVDVGAYPKCATGAEHEIAADQLGPADPMSRAGTITPSDSGVIDVMVLYTSAAVTAAGGDDAIAALANQAIDTTNLTYGNSSVNPRVRLVHHEAVSYTEVTFSASLASLAGTSDGDMDGIHALRNTHNADMVSLLISNSSSCGVAYQMTTLSSGFANWAFSVVDDGCAVGNLSFPHELGHNLGSQHAVGDSGNAQGAGVFNYSNGWRWTGDTLGVQRSVMAYSPGTRIAYFSNPDVIVDGQPTGRALGLADEAHNALSINNAAATAANWRDGPTREIALIGNNNDISDGDATPSTADDTDFGQSPLNETVTHTFTIRNLGDSDLSLTGNPIVAVSGSAAFSVTSQPTTPVTPATAVTFDVAYQPTAVGTDNGTISIANNDSDENPFNFAIEGTGAGLPSLPFSETFESGELGYWWQTSSTNEGRIIVSTGNSPNGGSYHLLMDDTFGGGNSSLNEAVLRVDVTGFGGVSLSFWHKDFGDEADSMPASFVGSTNADGVAVSTDGNNWTRAVSLTTSASYAQHVIDVSALLPGVSAQSTTILYVKFQQYDNFPIGSGDGFAFDDISITATSSTLPSVTDHPQSLTKDPGEAATFTVTATGQDPLNYQWRQDASNIPGATSTSYTIASVQESDEGSYDCVVTNSSGTATSNAATLTVNDPPAITAQPQSLTKDPGEAATFTVTATGAATLTYQWRKDAGDISGATNASYTIASVQESDEGSYDCVVANSIGTATSDPATLTLTDPPPAPLNVTARPLAAFGRIILKWSAAPGATGYTISYDDETTDPFGPPARDGTPASGSDVGNVTRVTIRGLRPGKRHYLAVTAYNGAGASSLSQVAAISAGNVTKAWIVGAAKVRRRRRYLYVLKLKWNNGAKTKAKSGVKWSLDRAGLRRAAIGRTSGKLSVKRKAALGWFKISAKYRGRTYRRSAKVVGGSARGVEADDDSIEDQMATPILLYRLSSRSTIFDNGRVLQRRAGRLFVDPIASHYAAIVTWRDGDRNGFYQRQDWHDNELADYVVDGPAGADVQVVASLARDGESLVLRRVQGLARELTLADVTLNATRVYQGREAALDAPAARYAAGALLARLDGRSTRSMAEAGTDFDSAIGDFLAALADRGFQEVPSARPRRHLAPAPVEGLILVYRQSRRSAVVGDGARLPRRQGGFLVVDPATDLVTSISTWTDVQNTRFYSRRDWGSGADLLLSYDVDAGRRALRVLAALSSASDAQGLTDFDLIDLRGPTENGLARTLRGRLQSGSDSGDAELPYPYFSNGAIGARLDGLRTRAATAAGDHAQAVADLIRWLEETRGFAAE